MYVQEYNLKYVDLIEEQLNEALTTYRKPIDGDNYVRRSNQRQEDGLQSPDGTRGRGVCVCVTNVSTSGRRLQRPNVYLPVHLYGQLVHDKTGCHLLEAQVMNETLQLQVLHSAVSWRFWRGCRDLAAVNVCVCVQSIVPDLSYTVRSPMLDTWEGIKQLKAALWALVSI